MRIFTKISAMFLIIAGVAKICSAFGGSKIMAESDPILSLSFRCLMLSTGAIELIVSMLCLSIKNVKLPLVLIAWMSTCFLVYRIGLWGMNWHRPCSCLGNLTDALPVSPQIADTAMKIILAYLLIGSYGCLFWLWRQKHKKASVVPVA